MKNSRPIHPTLLPTALCILVLASLAWFRDDVISDADLDAAVDQVLVRKEKAYVAKLKPKIAQILEDFDTKLAENEKDPQTLEDLFLPLFRLVTSVAEPQPDK